MEIYFNPQRKSKLKKGNLRPRVAATSPLAEGDFCAVGGNEQIRAGGCVVLGEGVDGCSALHEIGLGDGDGVVAGVGVAEPPVGAFGLRADLDGKGCGRNQVAASTANTRKDTVRPDIVERVACLTEFESEYNSPTPAPAIKWVVNRNSAPRRARRWHVQSDVGKLCSGKETQLSSTEGHGVKVQAPLKNSSWFHLLLSVHSREDLSTSYFAGWHSQRCWLARGFIPHARFPDQEIRGILREFREFLRFCSQ